jgi:O-antigen/teichoic acid export membrane protein
VTTQGIEPPTQDPSATDQVKPPTIIGFLRRAGLAFLSQGGQAVSSFLLTIVVSRAVDPSIRGEFVLLTLIPQVGAYLVTLGLPGAVMRGAAAEAEHRPSLLGVSAIASLAAGVILTILTPVLMKLAHSSSPPVLLVFAGATALAWLIFASWFTFGCERFLLAGALRTGPILATAFAILALDALGHKGLTVLFAPWAIFHLLTASGSVAYLYRGYGFARPRLTQTLEWIHYGIRYWAIQILDLVTLRFDQLILGWLGTTTAVGLYSIGVSLSEGILLATTAVGLVVFLDSAKGETGTPFHHKLTVTILASCLAAGALALFADPIIRILFGERYHGATELTRILVIGTPGLVVLRLVTNRLSGAGRPGTASIYALVAFATTTALDLLLIPSHGATGAAWASAVGYNLGGVVALITIRRVSAQGPSKPLAAQTPTAMTVPAATATSSDPGG